MRIKEIYLGEKDIIYADNKSFDFGDMIINDINDFIYNSLIWGIYDEYDKLTFKEEYIKDNSEEEYLNIVKTATNILEGLKTRDAYKCGNVLIIRCD